MKKAEEKPRWFFVDEAGDPNFYAKRSKQLIVGQEGCSKTLILGFVRTYDPQQMRSKLADARIALAADRYLVDIPSIKKSLVHFHAKDDCPEVRKLVFDAIDKMDFRAQVIVARKIENIFRTKHNGSQGDFYDHLVKLLFRNQLHLATDNHITFARRGNRARQHQLRSAVDGSVAEFHSKYKNADQTVIAVDTNQPAQEPVLQVIDYVNWSVQRAFERGEMRYFEFLRSKVELVWDCYDWKKINSKESVMYDRKQNPFQITKASPLS
jgi:hypothetical protein